MPPQAKRRTSILRRVPSLDVPEPIYRHASPSGPWPWLDLDSKLNAELDAPAQQEPLTCEHRDGMCPCWKQYPANLYPNWTTNRVRHSKIKDIQALGQCVIYHVNVWNDGSFSDPGNYLVPAKENEFWKKLQEKPRQTLRLQALFVENMTLSVLQMLGTKYNIEPFFFSSSVNDIPSRYQENPTDRDHITITLSFLRARPIKYEASYTSSSHDFPMIDPQLPLYLPSSSDNTDNYILLLDFMAIHMVRTPTGSTIISYHPTADRQTTSAKVLHDLLLLAGQSVYWQKIYQSSNDPTFIILTIIWYTIYSWDHALAKLGSYIRQLESSVIRTNSIRFVQELHRIRADLLRYATLLDDLQNSVEYLSKLTNPTVPLSSQDQSSALLQKECKVLLDEVNRLAKYRSSNEQRLNNVIQLVFNSVNIEDSKNMKYISYLTMFFLPASFVANIFGMNIREIVPQTYGSLVHYFLIAGPLTTITIWILIAIQGRWQQDGSERSIGRRLFWPIILIGQQSPYLRRNYNVFK